MARIPKKPQRVNKSKESTGPSRKPKKPQGVNKSKESTGSSRKPKIPPTELPESAQSKGEAMAETPTAANPQLAPEDVLAAAVRQIGRLCELLTNRAAETLAPLIPATT